MICLFNIYQKKKITIWYCWRTKSVGPRRIWMRIIIVMKLRQHSPNQHILLNKHCNWSKSLWSWGEHQYFHQEAYWPSFVVLHGPDWGDTQRPKVISDAKSIQLEGDTGAPIFHCAWAFSGTDFPLAFNVLH